MNMTVRSKILGLAGVAFVGLAALAICSQIDMRRVYGNASYANGHTVPSLLVLNDMQRAFAGQRLLYWEGLAQTDPAVIAALTDKLKASRAALAKAYEDYVPLVADDKDRELLAAERAATDSYYQLIDRGLAFAADGHKAEARDLVMQSQSTIDTLNAAVQAHLEYNKQLGAAAAVAAAQTEGVAAWVESFLGLGVAVFLGVVAVAVTRNITGQLGGEPAQVAAVARRVAEGDFSSEIALRNGDAASLLATVAAMQRSLRERCDQDGERSDDDRARMAAELAAAAENTRIRTALDRVSVGVMLADLEGRIIYANDCSMSIFRSRAAAIRSHVPQFDAERILGSQIDIFHRNPSHQKNMLAGLSGAHTADLKMGGVTLGATFTPVVDNNGTRLGYVVQWSDRTEEVATEEEVQRTVAAAIDGDMTVRIREDDKSGFFKTLAGGVNQLLGSMADVLRTISASAAEVGTGAEEISRGNADLSQRTEQQASSLEETASSMEEMTSAVKNNADNAAQASQLALSAREQAERGGAVVQSAVVAMSEINESSKRIADIIGVIDAIAFQTNLLALNAAVEAARAGEQGRGFAVVASEVRNLASRSAAAAKEIKSLIQASVAKVDDGSKLVDDSGKVLQEIVAGVKRVTDVVAEIAASCQEQASGIEQVNKAVMSMDEVTQQNAALVEQATAAAQSLNQQASNLTQLMARYRVGGDVAVRSVKTVVPERRAASRPWSKPKRPVATAAPVPAPAPAPQPKAAAAAGSDAEWQQF